MKKLFLLIICAAFLVAGCAESDLGADLRHRDAVLLKAGMIYYGDDPAKEGFDDMYYAFAATDEEMDEASKDALKSFKKRVRKMSYDDRSYLKSVFNDIADLADLANYSYKDGPAVIPDGWVDLGAQSPEIQRIFNKSSVSKYLPMGLKCSLMGKGDRRVLVFAGTDFPTSWKKIDQVMHFISDAYEDVYGALNMDASQVVMAGQIVDELLAGGYVTLDNLEFAGHSLGGRLASEMSVKYGCPAVLFNAAGVSPEVYQQYEESRTNAKGDWRGYIVNVVSANDPLTCAQRYMSGSTAPLKTKVAEVLSTDKKTVDKFVSLGLDILGTVVDKVAGESQVVETVKDLSSEYGSVVDKLYKRDYRAIGAVMPIRENLGGHGIRELAESLRSRADFI